MLLEYVQTRDAASLHPRSRRLEITGKVPEGSLFCRPCCRHFGVAIVGILEVAGVGNAEIVPILPKLLIGAGCYRSRSFDGEIECPGAPRCVVHTRGCMSALGSSKWVIIALSNSHYQRWWDMLEGSIIRMVGLVLSRTAFLGWQVSRN